jgi:hypothetical protein
VWTGTDSNGFRSGSGAYCGDWTSEAGTGTYGYSDLVTWYWSDIGYPTACTDLAAIYCVEQ